MCGEFGSLTPDSNVTVKITESCRATSGISNVRSKTVLMMVSAAGSLKVKGSVRISNKRPVTLTDVAGFGARSRYSMARVYVVSCTRSVGGETVVTAATVDDEVDKRFMSIVNAPLVSNADASCRVRTPFCSSD